MKLVFQCFLQLLFTFPKFQPFNNFFSRSIKHEIICEHILSNKMCNQLLEAYATALVQFTLHARFSMSLACSDTFQSAPFAASMIVFSTTHFFSINPKKHHNKKCCILKCFNPGVECKGQESQKLVLDETFFPSVWQCYITEKTNVALGIKYNTKGIAKEVQVKRMKKTSCCKIVV